uniref:Beta-lactamase domain-containing protein n=1 Tax=Syphacia muris TaxID=451379 RepID=A0A0N5AFP0_9BILA
MPRLPVLIDGDCDSRFEAVRQVFRENFEHGLESEGAAFAVYLNGEKVVDLWGGYADSTANRKWKSNTVSMFFSSTKGICSICFAMLVDRGLVDYEDLVVKHWPEFGQNGKENITIDQLLSHQAGLAYVDGVIDESCIKDWKKMSAVFEKQAPNWTPGKQLGYHAVTYGWLVDQLIRRIDPKKRGVSTFFKQELAIPYDLDITIGSPLDQEHRVARLSRPSKLSIAREVLEYHVILKFIWNTIAAHHSPNTILRKIMQNIAWIGNDVLMFNNPDYRSLDMPSVTGVGTARSLAKLYSLLAVGKLLMPKTMEKLMNPLVIDKHDAVLSITNTVGRGFEYTKNSKDQWIFGHPGLGGQNAKVDITNRVSYSYICNGMKAGFQDYTNTTMRLQRALYECLEKNSLLAGDSAAANPSPTLQPNPEINPPEDSDVELNAATAIAAEMVAKAATTAAVESLRCDRRVAAVTPNTSA